MAANETLKRFFQALTDQEQQFRDEFVRDNLGLLLRAAINEVDWYAYNFARQEVPTHEQVEHMYLLNLGLTRLITVALSSRDGYDVPIVQFRRRTDLSMPALKLLAGLGMIEHGRRMAQSVEAGICRIEEESQNNFVVWVPSDVNDDELYEREVAGHYRRWHTQMVYESTREFMTEEVESQVERELTELVYPFMRFFIGYGGTPFLDEYFFSLAYWEVSSWDGMDDFPPSANFGGVSFSSYRFAMAFLVSLAMKHERFAEALVRKNSETQLADVLTISAERSGFLESIRDAVRYFGAVVGEEISIDQAATIFDALSVERGRIGAISKPGSALPLIVCFSPTALIRVQSAASSSAARFLLDSLRLNFPKDYSRNQQARELAMQRSVQKMLSDAFDGLFFRENITVRIAGRVATDIDLVVGDSVTGCLLLCQLKHQEVHGIDLHAKRERGARLRDQVRTWLGAVRGWVEQTGTSELRAALRIPKGFPQPVVYYAGIARHHASALGGLREGPDFLYATFLQLFNAIQIVRVRGEEGANLMSVISVIQDFAERSRKQMHATEEEVKWNVRDLSFAVRIIEGSVGSD